VSYPLRTIPRWQLKQNLRKLTYPYHARPIPIDHIATKFTKEILSRCFLAKCRALVCSNTPAPTVLFGRRFWERIMDRATGEVIKGYSDVALHNFWYKYLLINEMKCLVTHVDDSVTWFVPCAKPYPRWTSITTVFTAHLWLAFLAACDTVCSCGFSLSYITRSIPLIRTTKHTITL
jgi:hypothetical protein